MQVYTTTQLAELLHSKPSTLRSYKQRYSDRFQEGESFVRDEQGSLLWTLQGATTLAQILDTPAAHHWLQTVAPTAPLPTPLATPPATPETLATLDTLAEAVAWQLIQQQFHHRLGASLQQILYSPTPAQQAYLDRLLLNLGLSMGWATLVQTLQSPLQQTWASIAAEQRAIAVLNYEDTPEEDTDPPPAPDFLGSADHPSAPFPRSPQLPSLSHGAPPPATPAPPFPTPEATSPNTSPSNTPPSNTSPSSPPPADPPLPESPFTGLAHPNDDP